MSGVLGYGGRTQAVLSTTLWSQTPTRAAISGTEGRIEVEGRFYGPASFTVTRRDGDAWTFSHPLAKGLQYEAAEVARRVAAGETESPRMSWRGTLEVMHTMDEIRAQIGVSYPGEVVINEGRPRCARPRPAASAAVPPRATPPGGAVRAGAAAGP